ncbi:transposase [Thioalkalivibrio sp.]|uniref:transposase n=1 Tax=Thioalkalivibrio sp. TaxID=2093813 RepID=UPI0039753D25
MPRASRHFLPGHIWHITHRCHERAFLLRYARDRRFWRARLYEARRRHGLCALNYVVTRNHVHLLVRDRGVGEIARSIQLIAGQTGQSFNRRKRRKGAFWEDRYHATAVESGEHLARCLVYIDLNMVRAGAVSHPREWESGGYREIQSPPRRYQVLDLEALTEALGLRNVEQLQDCHRRWVDDTLASAAIARDDRWTRSLAVGSEPFVQRVQQEMGLDARFRAIKSDGVAACLREPAVAYEATFGPEKGPSSGSGAPE